MQKYIDVLINELGFKQQSIQGTMIPDRFETDTLLIMIDKEGDIIFDAPKFMVYYKNAISVKDRMTPVYIKYNDECFSKMVEYIKESNFNNIKLLGFTNPYTNIIEQLFDRNMVTSYVLKKADIDKYFNIYKNIIDRNIIYKHAKYNKMSTMEPSMLIKNNTLIRHYYFAPIHYMLKIIIEDTKLILIEKVSEFKNNDMLFEEYETEIDIKEVL